MSLFAVGIYNAPSGRSASIMDDFKKEGIPHNNINHLHNGKLMLHVVVCIQAQEDTGLQCLCQL